MAEYVDLSERVTATLYSAEYEEWTQRTITIADVLDSVCDDYTVLSSVQQDIIYCKDCKDYHKIPTGEVWTCRYFRRAVMGNDYCSYAERRTDGSD